MFGKFLFWIKKGHAKLGGTALVLLGGLVATPASAFTVTVIGQDGNPVSGFRWLLEEDTSHGVTAGVKAAEPLSLTFHRSYAPVSASGESTAGNGTAVINGPGPADQRYFVSILPHGGHTLSGAPVAVGDEQITVVVDELPVPTAQISVFAFHDSSPINNAPDLPQENGLAGFSVKVIDAAGRYGIPGDQIVQDAFGNPLGTEYNADGSVGTMGDGVITTGENGVALVKNLAPAKYGIEVVPPAGENWHQTSTIEGSKTIDAWVKAGEPSYFLEFGPPGHHVFVGFVRPTNDTGVLTGGSSISGRITNLHTSRPPSFEFFSAQPAPACWVALNEVVGGQTGRGLYAQLCNEDSTFSIPNVPVGNQYELVVFDENLDLIIARIGVSVNEDGSCNTLASCDLGDVPVFNWFARFESSVFFDRNENGYRDCFAADGTTPSSDLAECDDPAVDDVPMSADSTAVNLRFRDGTVYQSFPVDTEGLAPFDEVFPFFHWLVAEVDFANLKATGATYVVDAGGPVAPGEALNPQPQCETVDPTAPPCTGVNAPITNPNTGDNLSRTLTGPVLTLGMQGFLGQTNVINWGKAPYGSPDADVSPYGDFPGPGDTDQDGDGEFDHGNGGISGIVFYATTRAEDDPRFGAAEEWEPGVPRVQVNLYQDLDTDGVVDDVNQDSTITLADVDNHPFGDFPGPGDTDHDGDGVFDFGDAIQVATTDSWDESLPTGCQGQTYIAPNGTVTDCFDGLRNFNQIREAVFDGGYAFDSRLARDSANNVLVDGSGNPVEIPGLDPGTYIVEAKLPPGYQHMKEEDRNVDFGDEYEPSPLLLPPVCVGDMRTVPAYFSMLTDASGALLPGVSTADAAAPFAGEVRPLCDRKQIRLSQSKNSAVDFFMFTQVPKAARVVGFILDDLANEFDANAPTFGEKFAPSWVPVSFRDWTGRQIARTYSDRFGKYNALLPSTYTANLPMASGMSPNMLTACMNDPGPVPNPNYDPADPNSPASITDPFFDRKYSQFCYTFQYMPGTTTYLDTPVIPVAAFAGADQFPLDCEFTAGTPRIYSVSGPDGGPYVEPGQVLTLVSLGSVEVPNPAYDGTSATTATVGRDYGFGLSQGTGTVTIGGVEVAADTWTNEMITLTVPAGVSSGELMVTRDNGNATKVGVTVAIGPRDPTTIHRVSSSMVPGATPIQDAIDSPDTNPGDLILVAPGKYNELVVLHKPVQLQGWGAGSTTISALRTPAELLKDWRIHVEELYTAGAFELLPEQEAAFNLDGTPTPDNEPDIFNTEEGPGILVVAKSTGNFGASPNARIDGFTITGAVQGGGIFVNGYVDYLEISNNRIIANQGTFGGGIRIGNPNLTTQTADGLAYVDNDNDSISIHHNHITQNGALSTAGGGIALYTGSDQYQVSDNQICGNFSQGNGGGIGHRGLSDGGVISHNTVVFNQSFNQGQTVSGGGIYIAGAPTLGVPPVPPATGPTPITPGAGAVAVDSNLIQGNHAGAGDGGGIRIENINGQDLEGGGDPTTLTYRIDIINNMIVNNVTGLAGGGISVQDAVDLHIVNNTVANNDSTATAGLAFDGPNQSQKQPAGIVSRPHSAALTERVGAGFTDPELVNNVIWHNRSFHWQVDPTDPTVFGLSPNVGAGESAVYEDLAVLPRGSGAALNPQSSILTDATGYDPSNLSADPMFVAEYMNGQPGQIIIINEATTIPTAVAFDEGGNMIDVRFGPLTLYDPAGGSLFGDYHILSGSPAVDSGDGAIALDHDFDSDTRPIGVQIDMGADEVSGGGAINVDSDGDGESDATDNCTEVGNANQRDTNGDGYGNLCDPDLDNDGTVGAADFVIFRSAYGTRLGAQGYNPDADLNGDAVVDVADLGILRAYYGRPPGPSAVGQ